LLVEEDLRVDIDRARRGVGVKIGNETGIKGVGVSARIVLILHFAVVEVWVLAVGADDQVG